MALGEGKRKSDLQEEERFVEACQGERQPATAHVNSGYQHALALLLEIRNIHVDESLRKPYLVFLKSLSQQSRIAWPMCPHSLPVRLPKKRCKSSDMLGEETNPAI